MLLMLINNYFNDCFIIHLIKLRIEKDELSEKFVTLKTESEKLQNRFRETESDLQAKSEALINAEKRLFSIIKELFSLIIKI